MAGGSPLLQTSRATAIVLTGLILATGASHLAFPAASGPATPRTLVVCSPGSPGDTAQAQPTMDAFAGEAAAAAGWTPGSLSAAYYESAEGGIGRLSRPDAAVALVSPAFLFEYGRRFSLQPRLEAIPEAGRGESYALAAHKGAIESPAAIAGWEIVGSPGFSPAFVREVLLRRWGSIPESVKITFSARVLASLRRAASGEKVAVLLDRAQAAALPSLPFAPDLEIVHRSEALPGGLLCLVGERLAAADSRRLLEGLLRLPERETGREVLKSMRLERFVAFDPAAAAAWIRPPGEARP